MGTAGGEQTWNGDIYGCVLSIKINNDIEALFVIIREEYLVREVIITLLILCMISSPQMIIHKMYLYRYSD